MINIQISANPQSLAGNSCEVFWQVDLPVDIAQKQLRPKTTNGIIKISNIKFKQQSDILAYSELKALNALFCANNGLKLLNIEKLEISDVQLLTTSNETVTALRGVSADTPISDFSRILLNVATPISTIFFGARFNRIELFSIPTESIQSYNEYDATNIIDFIYVETEVGNLSISRRALESFTRKTKKINAYYELAKVLSTSKLTVKYQTPLEREERISKYNFDCEIVSVENTDPVYNGINVLIPKKNIERNGVECFSIITLFDEIKPKYPKSNQSVIPNSRNNQVNTPISNKQVTNESRFVSDILYIEINRESSMVSAQFGNVVISIDMFKTSQNELNYIDAAYMAINMIQMECQPEKRVRIFTNETLLVESFHDVEKINRLVDVNCRDSVKLQERITMLSYKTRLIGIIKESAYGLRPVPLANEPLLYNQIKFSAFGKIRKGSKIVILTPHAFSSFIKRMSKDEIAVGGRNPLAYLTKLIKNGYWIIKKDPEILGKEKWLNKETNSMIVIVNDESDNTALVVTYFRAHKYEDIQYKLDHPDTYEQVEEEIANESIRKVKIID
ncbi:hypothetical protein C9J21_17915 [Photobacterium phosphoreum]|uniref:hypothetical protein n=1 Tax=Photobacterium phosphoreum TaxID=659 RepID=UPI000D15B036|nr:hypothetical protein [Photobacterium phosphoreum]PSW31226.1 hypothetical protein C9J21_17915 [Photobacterium phosphoreum]